jgi:hypothetical protein
MNRMVANLQKENEIKENKLKRKMERIRSNLEAVYKYQNSHKEECKAAHKRYYQNNKEVINDKRKIYLKDHPEILVIRRNKAKNNYITCECGREVQKKGYMQHKRTNKHIEIMNSK